MKILTKFNLQFSKSKVANVKKSVVAGYNKRKFVLITMKNVTKTNFIIIFYLIKNNNN